MGESISVDGAGLLAQVLPVGILLLVIEARVLANFPRKRIKWSGYNHASRQFCGIIGMLNVPSVFFCVQAVSRNEPVVGLQSGIVWVTGTLLAGASIALLADLAFLPGKDTEPSPAPNEPVSKARGAQPRKKPRSRRGAR
ncbi:hypothetical protein EDF55_2216 [Curtobacterium sp. ZW137]|nr:hypothetical protein EDF55_2216 [Curtobacterium sp. ZW137]